MRARAKKTLRVQKKAPEEEKSHASVGDMLPFLSLSLSLSLFLVYLVLCVVNAMNGEA
jgi:hypothetical protein